MATNTNKSKTKPVAGRKTKNRQTAAYGMR